MAKSKSVRARLTWEEIRKIEKDWKDDTGPGNEDITKLIRHIKFIECLLDEVSKPRSKSEMKRINVLNGRLINEGCD